MSVANTFLLRIYDSQQIELANTGQNLNLLHSFSSYCYNIYYHGYTCELIRTRSEHSLRAMFKARILFSS